MSVRKARHNWGFGWGFALGWLTALLVIVTIALWHYPPPHQSAIDPDIRHLNE